MGIAVGISDFSKPAHTASTSRSHAVELPVFRHNTWYLFSGFTIVTTILWGCLYCGRVCAGSMTQLMDKVVPATAFEVRDIDERASYIKYGLLAATVLLPHYENISIYRYVEPF
jgi:hypothetical protein